ncbi:MAG TPA: FAD-dependent oxidoreductase [Beijerinckiaceae bacterium]|jgi:NADPH-dependent 2,4-dienoyl-CoA reductase/sulfur reductase-like enzyme
MADPVVAIVGAGPAGVRAAETLARAGIKPILFDEAERPGGQIYRQPPKGAERAGIYGLEAKKAEAVHRVVSELGARVEYRPRTLVWNVFESRLDLLDANGYGEQRFDRLILATGAMDRALPFPGWTLPGVFTLGGAQIALKAQGVSIGRRVAFVGAGPLLPLVAHQYAKAGAELVAVLDATPFAAKIAQLPGMMAELGTLAKGLWYTARNRLHGLKVQYGVGAIRAEGTARVEALAWRDGAGRGHRVACDAVGASFGLRSETQLADLAGCAFAFDPVERQWRPERTPEGRSSVPGVYLAGDGARIGGADMAELQGRRTALALLEDLGLAVDPAERARLDAALARQARFRRALEAAYPFPGHLVDDIGDDEIVCRCEGITAGTLKEAAREKGAAEMNQLKAFTRIGMGRCQGRVCGHAAAELLARARGTPVESIGRLRGQPPVKPIPVLGGEP